MVLKEAYRYQNYLDKLIREAEGYLLKKEFITKTTETHNRTKGNPDALDETIEVKGLEVEFTPMQIVDFLKDVIDEKQKLSDAIVTAKKTIEIDIDSAMAMNKIKQGYVSVLNIMANTKATESQSRGTGYMFNNEKNQVTYYYDIMKTVQIDYDRNDIKGLIRKYKKECDEISSKKDLIDLTTEVKYIPKYELDSPLEDVV